MPKELTTDDIMRLVGSLQVSERIKLLRRLASPTDTDASTYGVAPPIDEEFSGEDELLALDADGWERFR